MSSQPVRKALVVGVGPEKGLGGALAKYFAEKGHRVFVAGRTAASLDKVVASIEQDGGQGAAVVCDATSEQSVASLFDQVKSDGAGRLDLVVYNVGNSTPGKVKDMDAAFFEQSWRTLCFGGFLVGKAAAQAMLPQGGTLIFTGASASLRGKAGFSAFNSGKAALRTFAQALAKEHGPDGLHVGHVIIDGGIAGEKWFSRIGKTPDEEDLKRYIALQALVESYWHLYQQQPHGWTFELDLRTSLENW